MRAGHALTLLALGLAAAPIATGESPSIEAVATVVAAAPQVTFGEAREGQFGRVALAGKPGETCRYRIDALDAATIDDGDGGAAPASCRFLDTPVAVRQSLTCPKGAQLAVQATSEDLTEAGASFSIEGGFLGFNGTLQKAEADGDAVTGVFDCTGDAADELAIGLILALSDAYAVLDTAETVGRVRIDVQLN